MTNPDANPPPLLTLTDVSLTLNQQQIVYDINLTIKPNQRLCLIGPNGAGKSSLVKLILGLVRPTSGKIHKLDDLTIGYVPQKFSVPDILPLRTIDLLGQAKKNRLTQQQIESLQQTLFIDELLERQVTALSGGERQRVLLARALLEKPDLLILDEPMQGLDPDSEKLMYQFIDQLPDFLNCAMLVVSHDLYWVMRNSHQVICLNKHICCHGKPLEIENLAVFQQLFMDNHHELGAEISSNTTMVDATLETAEAMSEQISSNIGKVDAHLVNNLAKKYRYERPYVHNHDHEHIGNDIKVRQSLTARHPDSCCNHQHNNKHSPNTNLNKNPNTPSRKENNQ